MLRIVKGNANLPVIPIPSGSDGLSNGASIRLVGFGITSANNSSNTQRRTVDVNVNQLSSALIQYSQTNGKGACSGDSGGPALFNNTVVGVTSFGDQNCTQFGASGRVSLVSNWITGFINGETPPPNCDQCFGAAVNGGGCAGAVDACFDDAACAALADCLYNCAPNSSTCINNCANQHAGGIDKYNAIFDCACNECSTECAAECADPSTSSSSNSSSASSGAGGGDTGAGGAGGGATGDDAGSDDGGGSKPVTTVTTCNCSTVGGPDASGSAALALGGFVALAFAAGRRRRQR
jgi:MYXO-CTERM domain-containing protein